MLANNSWETIVKSITKEKKFPSPVTMEKSIRLVEFLNKINKDPYIHDKVALKGGTALNLFLLDLPRISVDIDFNYIPPTNDTQAQEDKFKIHQAMQAIIEDNKYIIRTAPEKLGIHSGSRWQLGYTNIRGREDTIEIDVMYSDRNPIWPVRFLDSVSLGKYTAHSIPILDEYELIASKLAALIKRTRLRDVYDTVQIFKLLQLDPEKMRTAFVISIAKSKKDLRTITPNGLVINKMSFGSERLYTCSEYRSVACIPGKSERECQIGTHRPSPVAMRYCRGNERRSSRIVEINEW